MEQIAGDSIPFKYALERSLAAWEQPPIAVTATTSAVLRSEQAAQNTALANTAPGMMLQFSIAGLLTAAQVIVAERKSRTLQRLLTTATGGYTSCWALPGHFHSHFRQFCCSSYLNHWCSKWATCVPGHLAGGRERGAMHCGLGLLIESWHSEEQAIIFSLIPCLCSPGWAGHRYR
jgi:hypothetical protein